jgi:hypothetical protein
VTTCDDLRLNREIRHEAIQIFIGQGIPAAVQLDNLSEQAVTERPSALRGAQAERLSNRADYEPHDLVLGTIALSLQPLDSTVEVHGTTATICLLVLGTGVMNVIAAADAAQGERK